MKTFFLALASSAALGLAADVPSQPLAKKGAPLRAEEPPSVIPPERSILAYLQRQLAENEPRLQIPSDPKAVPEWREKVARRLPELLALELSVPVPLNARLIDTRQREGYRIEHVAFWSEAGVEVPAYVLIPDGASAERPVPAVLCLQGLVPGGKGRARWRSGKQSRSQVRARALSRRLRPTVCPCGVRHPRHGYALRRRADPARAPSPSD